MSVGRQAVKYTATAVFIAAIIIVSSTLYLNPLSKGGIQSGSSASLVIQLTDPPIVPRGTSSLNLTYSSISLLVGQPTGTGQQTIKSVAPSGGSATVDLLKLQNVSKTIALASLPNGSVIYSFTFAVTNIAIDVNGTKSPVTLAAGGSSLNVIIAHPARIVGTQVALLRLDPVVVSTPAGYQMIPSAVGIVRGVNSQNEQGIGYQQELSTEDRDLLDHTGSNFSASLKALAVSGNNTSIEIEVKNIGNGTAILSGVSIHGNFSAVGRVCTTSGQTTTQSTSTESSGTTTFQSQDMTMECEMDSFDGVLFIPVNSTITGTSCVAVQMHLPTGDLGEGGAGGIALAKGQCVDLTFSGEIKFGSSNLAYVPSTLAGQVYSVHVVAWGWASQMLSCTLPLSQTSCNTVIRQPD